MPGLLDDVLHKNKRVNHERGRDEESNAVEKIGNYKVDSEGKSQDNWCVTTWRALNQIEWWG